MAAAEAIHAVVGDDLAPDYTCRALDPGWHRRWLRAVAADPMRRRASLRRFVTALLLVG